MRYSWAMELQLRLLERWVSRTGQKFVEDFYSSFTHLTPARRDSIINTGMDHCMFGETFAWSSEMCDVLMDLSSNLPDWSLTPELLPAPYGFMVFEKPLPLDTQRFASKNRGYSLNPRAIGWNAHHFETDGNGVTVDPNKPNWSEFITHVSFIVYSHPNDGDDAEIPSTLTLPAPFTIWNWKIGETISETENRIMSHQREMYPDLTDELADQDMLSIRHRRVEYFGAALLLMNQKILVDRKEIVKQSLERKMRNAGWKHEPNVRVVVLRHTTTANPEGPSRDIERTHRWWTRSHWRQQAYGPKKSLRKPLLIFAHLNGPEGLPVKPAKKNLFAVVQ